MKKYTQKDFENFEIVNGYRICPSGDYTAIKKFKDKCKFSMDCKFGDNTIFEERCSFGVRCSFGEKCRFEYSCSFGERCSFEYSCSFGDVSSFSECCNFERNCYFGYSCSFGESCDFGKFCEFKTGCSFGESCDFGEFCKFKTGCSFGESCRFGEHCSIKNIKFKKILKFEGFGSKKRCTYFFLTEYDKIFIRCGCFSGYIDEFRKKVTKTHKDNFYAQGYLKVAELAEWQLKNDLEG